jgi:hypothetical protein
MSTRDDDVEKLKRYVLGKEFFYHATFLISTNLPFKLISLIKFSNARILSRSGKKLQRKNNKKGKHEPVDYLRFHFTV